MAQKTLSRRSLVCAGAALFTSEAARLVKAESSANSALKVAIFSKHLSFLKGADLAEAAAQIGFDAIDLTVRKGGHVSPERVRQDLPPLVAIIRQHGLQVPMITTDIVDAHTPYAAGILSTAAGLGIRNYRWAGFKYTDDQPIAKQLDDLKPRIAALAAVNAQYGIGAMYHTHSGVDLVGAPIWDLHELLNGMDPASVGVNYDIGHATVEGGLGGWIDSFRVTGPYLRGIAVKDFLWERDAHGNWRPAWKPLGEGMVRFGRFFELVAAARFSGPLQLHFEYPIGATKADTAAPDDRNAVFDAMRRDLRQLRSYLEKGTLA